MSGITNNLNANNNTNAPTPSTTDSASEKVYTASDLAACDVILKELFDDVVKAKNALQREILDKDLALKGPLAELRASIEKLNQVNEKIASLELMHLMNVETLARVQEGPLNTFSILEHPALTSTLLPLSSASSSSSASTTKNPSLLMASSNPAQAPTPNNNNNNANAPTPATTSSRSEKVYKAQDLIASNTLLKKMFNDVIGEKSTLEKEISNRKSALRIPIAELQTSQEKLKQVHTRSENIQLMHYLTVEKLLCVKEEPLKTFAVRRNAALASSFLLPLPASSSSSTSTTQNSSLLMPSSKPAQAPTHISSSPTSTSSSSGSPAPSSTLATPSASSTLSSSSSSMSILSNHATLTSNNNAINKPSQTTPHSIDIANPTPPTVPTITETHSLSLSQPATALPVIPSSSSGSSAPSSALITSSASSTLPSSSSSTSNKSNDVVPSSSTDALDDDVTDSDEDNKPLFTRFGKSQAFNKQKQPPASTLGFNKSPKKSKTK